MIETAIGTILLTFLDEKAVATQISLQNVRDLRLIPVSGRYLLRSILVNIMSHTILQHQLELALHVCNNQRGVHPLSSRQNQHFYRRRLQKALRHVFVPPLPILFCIE